jgi:hypothetical protein
VVVGVWGSTSVEDSADTANIDWDNLDKVESLDPTLGGATSSRDDAVELDDTDK